MKKSSKIPLVLVGDASNDGYTLSFYVDEESKHYFVAIVKDKIKNKEDYDQIILSELDVKDISRWLQVAEVKTPPRLYVSCVSNCEVLMFDKIDGGVYIQLYQVASFKRQRRGKTDDEFSMSCKMAGQLGRGLQIYLHTGTPCVNINNVDK